MLLWRSASHRVPVLAAIAFAASACSGPAEQTPAPSSAPAAATAQPTAKPSVAPAAADPAWHYEGAEGPEHWGALSPKFATCGSGRLQSPIDIANPVSGSAAAPLKPQFPPSTLKAAQHEHVADVINNGHTIQINYGGADTLTIANDTYALAHFHFHSPSEHTVNGKHFADGNAPGAPDCRRQAGSGRSAHRRGCTQQSVRSRVGQSAEAEGGEDASTRLSLWRSRTCCRRCARRIATTARSPRRRAPKGSAGSS